MRKKLHGLDRLTDTAQDAKAALPDLIKRRDEVSQELSRLNSRIHALTAFVEAFGPELGMGNSPVQTSVMQLIGTTKASSVIVPRQRAQHGLAAKVVDELLAPGKKFKFGELKKAAQTAGGIKFGGTSVYRALIAGEKTGRYKKDGVYWQRKT
jgi:hypothetical protein